MEKEDARTKHTKDGAFVLGSAIGRCQVDRGVRARRASALSTKLSQFDHIGRALSRPRFEDRNTAVAACDFANAAYCGDTGDL